MLMNTNTNMYNPPKNLNKNTTYIHALKTLSHILTCWTPLLGGCC